MLDKGGVRGVARLPLSPRAAVRSIGLGEDHPPATRLAADNAGPPLIDPTLPRRPREACLGDAPDRDLERVLEARLAALVPAPVREREAPVDLGLVLVLALRREEGVELGPGVD